MGQVLLCAGFHVVGWEAVGREHCCERYVSRVFECVKLVAGSLNRVGRRGLYKVRRQSRKGALTIVFLVELRKETLDGIQRW